MFKQFQNGSQINFIKGQDFNGSCSQAYQFNTQNTVTLRNTIESWLSLSLSSPGDFMQTKAARSAAYLTEKI